MKPIDEAEHVRVMLHTGSMMTHEQKMKVVERIRDNAIAAIVKIRPETITEGHDLTLPYQSYHFISELRKETIPPKLAANLNLLEVCTSSIDNRQIFANAICSAYAQTDSGLISGYEYKISQSEKASKPRGKVTDDGETIGDLIERLAHERDALGDYIPAPDLWEPLSAALEEAEANPILKRNNSEPRKSFYTFTTPNGGAVRRIQRSTFENKISACRKKLSR